MDEHKLLGDIRRVATEPVYQGLFLIALLIAAFASDAASLAAMIGHLAWPASVVVVAVLLKTPLTAWLDSTSKIALKIPGGTEVQLEKDVARGILQDVLDGIDSLVGDMSDKEKALVTKLKAGSEGDTVIEVYPDFVRSTDTQKNPAHETLRACRKKHLIRPKEGGRWSENKRIEITPFGRLVTDLRANAFKVERTNS